MEERDTVFTTRVGPEGAPAVGTRMSVVKNTERSKPGRLRLKEAVPDPDGPWVVTGITPYEDGTADLYLERVGSTGRP